LVLLSAERCFQNFPRDCCFWYLGRWPSPCGLVPCRSNRPKSLPAGNGAGGAGGTSSRGQPGPYCWFTWSISFSRGRVNGLFQHDSAFPASALLRRLLMPVWIYLRGLAGFALGAGSRPTYILGHSYPHGVWFYFPVIFLLKSQLSFLLLLLIAGGAALLRKGRARSAEAPSAIPADAAFQWRCLWVSLVLYVVVCVLNRLDISVRHFLIAIALIILTLAPLPRMLQTLRAASPRLATAGQLLVWIFCVDQPDFGGACLSLFLPLHQFTRHEEAGLFAGERFQSRLGPGLSRSAGLRTEQFSLARAAGSLWLLRRWRLHSQRQFLELPNALARGWGKWVIVSANNLADAQNCLWLMNNQYPSQPLAGGSLYSRQVAGHYSGRGTTRRPASLDGVSFFWRDERLRSPGIFVGLHSRSSATPAHHGPRAGEDGRSTRRSGRNKRISPTLARIQTRRA